MSRRTLLGLPLWTAALGTFSADAFAAPVDDAAAVKEAIERGRAWLLKQQASDGGWHSTVYGQMQCGVGNTALVLYAFANLPTTATQSSRAQIERGLDFLLLNLAEPGYVRSPEGESDYPTYATALTLTALNRLQIEEWQSQQSRMRRYLIAAQQTVARGWSATRLDLGGWNATDTLPAGPDVQDGTSVSIMRFVIEALLASGDLPDPTRMAALDYLGRCQSLRAAGGDGGFWFTPEPKNPLNKAGWATKDGTARAQSYGTPTADGLWILRQCGVLSEDTRRSDAWQWLREHSALDRVPGIQETESAELAMRQGLRFYYWSSLAGLRDSFATEEYAQLAEKLSAAILAAQNSEGAWRNADNSMREDDPLIATSWALLALGRLTRGGSGPLK